MARTSASLSDDTTLDNISFETRNSLLLRGAPRPIYMTGLGSSIADTMYLDLEPTSKKQLSRCLAHIYDCQDEPGFPPLPNFNVFLTALARPRWRWTPHARAVFRRIGRIIHEFHCFGTVQVTEREITTQRRRASLRSRNRNRPNIASGGREAAEAAASTNAEGSVRFRDQGSQVSELV